MSKPQIPEPVELDLPGRVSNIRLRQSNGLMAVFEAVANALQSVSEAGKGANGRITITVLRSDIPAQAGQQRKIVGFEVSDNGAGFNDDNYKSFKKSDSTRKREVGGKGVGRLTWLKVFRSVQIDSRYVDSKGKDATRSFQFDLNGVTPTTAKPTKTVGATVTLRDPHSPYASSLQVSAEKLAESIIEHCLLSLLDSNAPEVQVVDGDDNIKLSKFMDEQFLSDRKVTPFEVKGIQFRQVHLLVRARTNSVHYIHLCAAKRSVKRKRLADRLPELAGPLAKPEESRSVVYAGYVTSKLLDERAYSDRDDFWLGQAYVKEGDDSTLITIEEEDILKEAENAAAEFLEPLLVPHRKTITQEITRFVEEDAPQFRYLLTRHPSRAIAIKANASKSEKYQHLSKIEFEHDEAVESKIGEALAQIDSSKSAMDHAEDVQALLAEVSEGAQAKLAKYVLYRRSVINILKKHQSLGDEGRFQLEKTVHQTVFPMRATSDDAPFHLWNLWLIDERLAFHRFLASDIPLNDLKQILVTKEKDRPDIAIFNRAMGFTDGIEQPFGSIIVVDFKRPSRKKYEADEKHEDPVLQVTEYMQKILDGEAFKSDGSHLRVPRGTPFYAYVIADLTPPLIRLLEGRGFLEMPGKRGYFQYNQSLTAYIEVIEYGKLIDDALKRNHVFFSVIGAHPTSDS